MTHAVIAIGSNLGDREATLRDATRDLAETGGVRMLGASPLVESAALTLDGVDDDAPRYLNAVLQVDTDLDARELLRALHQIEQRHGRQRHTRWGDRTLDLDLIVHGDTVSDDDELTLPHPRAAERSFVLYPWYLLDPEAVLPGMGPIRHAVASAPAEVTVRKTTPLWEKS